MDLDNQDEAIIEHVPVVVIIIIVVANATAAATALYSYSSTMYTALMIFDLLPRDSNLCKIEKSSSLLQVIT